MKEGAVQNVNRHEGLTVKVRNSGQQISLHDFILGMITSSLGIDADSPRSFRRCIIEEAIDGYYVDGPGIDRINDILFGWAGLTFSVPHGGGSE